MIKGRDSVKAISSFFVSYTQQATFDVTVITRYNKNECNCS